MTTADEAAGGLSETEHSTQLRRAVVASTVGTVIEAYDFLLYVLVAPLVFAKLYFPDSDPLVGTLQAFGIYAVGFIARPVGAAFFGHYGDRIGRKATLIATLLLTGLSTFAVGFVPSYAQIGIWGAVILTIVRFIQGVGIGGEWGGATLMAMEWARTNKHRGFITAWPQWGGPAGLFLANILVLIFSAISGDQFLEWGWRVPFWLSIVMVGIGLYIRLGLLETPVFQRILDRQQIASAPVLEVLRRQPREIILTALARIAEQGPFYVFAAFLFTYGTTVLHSSRDLLLTGLLVGTGLSAVTIPLSGHRSEEHTSELQSPCNLVCRLLLATKKLLNAQEFKSPMGGVTMERLPTLSSRSTMTDPSPAICAESMRARASSTTTLLCAPRISDT